MRVCLINCIALDLNFVINESNRISLCYILRNKLHPSLKGRKYYFIDTSFKVYLEGN